ncbi:MAG: hypothetical protein ABI995_15365, partial [Acidobacteriota bacterium]
MPRKTLPWFYLVLLILLHVWICQEAFLTESTGHWQSMHGMWMASARLMGLHWLPPQWWSYGGGGAPMEYVYAPLIPAATAALSSLLHISLPTAFHLLSGIVYVLGPVLLYLASWRLFRAPGYSFAAALAYSLLSFSQIIVPDAAFRADGLLSARRFYVLFDWDDLPHLTSLALLPVAVLFLARAPQRRRWWDGCLAGLTMALMMLANMFGIILVAIVAITVPLALERRPQLALFVRSALIAAASWVLVSPWLPPSLLLAIRRVSVSDGEADTTLHAAYALAVIAAVSTLVWFFASRRNVEWPLRWLMLFTCWAVLIPVLAQYWGPHFAPQPGRYKLELEMAVAWLGVFALRPLIRRTPLLARIALGILLGVAVVWQVDSHREFAQILLRPVDAPTSLEYRTAKWMETNFPGQRVMMTGSMALWLNLYTNQPQVIGQSYSTSLNWMEQVATYTMYSSQNTGARGGEYSLLWLQANGAQAIAVPGAKSPDAWRPFTNPLQFEGVLPVLWHEDDTTIYRVPQVTAS